MFFPRGGGCMRVSPCALRPCKNIYDRSGSCLNPRKHAPARAAALTLPPPPLLDWKPSGGRARCPRLFTHAAAAIRNQVGEVKKPREMDGDGRPVAWRVPSFPGVSIVSKRSFVFMLAITPLSTVVGP